MPLIKSGSKKAVSENISEFHTGKTYERTLRRFGKKTADRQAVAAALSNQRKYAKRAGGGPTPTPWFARQEARSIVHQGMLHGITPGRSDVLPINVPSGAYVIPSDVVSGLGQGNSQAGASILGRMFNTGPLGMPTMKMGGSGRHTMRMGTPRLPKGAKISAFADGGSPDDQQGNVPIVAASGEFIVHPDAVQSIGDGDMKKGHEILDKFVLHARKQHINTLKNLKPPVKS